MGTIYQINCPKCDYHKKLFLGAGIMSCNPKAIVSEFNPDLTYDFYNAYQNNTLSNFNFSRELGFCSHCHTYLEAPTLHYETSNLKASNLLGDCKTCHSHLTIINATHITCPTCGELLTLTPCGHWD